MPRLGERRTLKNGRVIEYRYPTLSDGTTGSKLVPVFVKTNEETLGGSSRSRSSRKLSMSNARKLLNREYAQEERPSSRRRKSRVLSASAKERLLSKLRKKSKSSRKSMKGGSRKNNVTGVRPVSLQEAVGLLRKYYSQK